MVSLDIDHGKTDIHQVFCLLTHMDRILCACLGHRQLNMFSFKFINTSCKTCVSLILLQLICELVELLPILCICSHELEAERLRKELNIADIDIKMQNFHQIYDQTVEDALGEVDVMVCLKVSEKN